MYRAFHAVNNLYISDINMQMVMDTLRLKRKTNKHTNERTNKQNMVTNQNAVADMGKTK